MGIPYEEPTMTNRTVSSVASVRILSLVTLIGFSTLIGTDVVSASNVVVGLSEDRGDVTVPTWLYLATGGGVIGASALLTMLVTDRETLSTYHDRSIGVSIDILVTSGSTVAGIVGVGSLLLAIVVAVFGPSIGLISATVLLTFVGVRALLTMVAYGVGNPWPSINPWRHIAVQLPNRGRPYPAEYGSWPAVLVLLGFIWLEVVAPLSSSPKTLLVVLLGYSAFTLGGAAAFTPDSWFRYGDPLSLWFRLYGAVAPIQRSETGLDIRFPGARLGDDDIVTDVSVVAFVLLLVWELTYSGFIVTDPGVRTIEALVGIGLPPSIVYLLLLVGGFGLFWGVYWFAAGRTRSRAGTYLSRRYLAVRFAPPLLAIAAGYHFAHYAGFTIQLWPQFVESLLAPIAPDPNPTQYALTPWFGYVEIVGILVGHVLAVWVAHTIAMELFPEKITALRSQYPFIAVMILFTMASLYLVSLPTTNPPYVSQ